MTHLHSPGWGDFFTHFCLQTHLSQAALPTYQSASYVFRLDGDLESINNEHLRKNYLSKIEARNLCLSVSVSLSLQRLRWRHGLWEESPHTLEERWVQTLSRLIPAPSAGSLPHCTMKALDLCTHGFQEPLMEPRTHLKVTKEMFGKIDFSQKPFHISHPPLCTQPTPTSFSSWTHEALELPYLFPLAEMLSPSDLYVSASFSSGRSLTFSERPPLHIPLPCPPVLVPSKYALGGFLIYVYINMSTSPSRMSSIKGGPYGSHLPLYRSNWQRPDVW